MINQSYPLRSHAQALDAAIRAVTAPDALIGVSTGGDFTNTYLIDGASAADQTAAASMYAAHDPVFLFLDKPVIQADNADTATITINALKPGAAPVTLLIGGNPVAVALVNGVGTVQITSAAPALITITVQNSQNRSTDSLTIEAI